MNCLETVQLEPFAEVVGDAYQLGYRFVGTSQNVSAVEVPIRLIEETVLAKASLTARIGPDGTVISHMLASYTEGAPGDPPAETAALDVLIQRAVNSENLRMEEATVSELNTLLQRLEYSIRLVKEAISQISSNSSTAV